MIGVVEYFVIILQGFCPGLNHGQKFGLLYMHSNDEHSDHETIQQEESTTVQTHSVMLIPAQSSDSSVPDSGNDQNDTQTSESEVTSWRERTDTNSDQHAVPKWDE